MEFQKQVILGREVGYSIRFEDCTSKDTCLKYSKKKSCEFLKIKEEGLFESTPRYVGSQGF